MRTLPHDLRYKLKEPIGALAKNDKELLRLLQDERYIVSLGDMVTYTLLKNDFSPIVCVVDFIIKRRRYPVDMKKLIQQYESKKIYVKNPAGCISDEMWNALEFTLKHIDEGPFTIEVDGEEDLASLPAIYMAPKDVTIIYGLPNKGVVVVKATEENKKKVKEILDKM